ncbi:hypothetical protein [Thermofilum pendens]
MSGGDWREALRRRREPVESAEPRYRHGLPFVRVSDVADQFFCELRVDLAYRLGVSTRANPTAKHK